MRVDRARCAGCSTSREMLAERGPGAVPTPSPSLSTTGAVTFGEIDERANRIANGLRGLWVGRGDRVLWWGDTALEAVPVFAALAETGRGLRPLNARMSPDEVAPVAEYAGPAYCSCGA